MHLKSPPWDSNPQPSAYKALALPIAPRGQNNNDRTISDFSKHVHLLATFNFMCFIFVSLNHCYVQSYCFLISSKGKDILRYEEPL